AAIGQDRVFSRRPLAVSWAELSASCGSGPPVIAGWIASRIAVWIWPLLRNEAACTAAVGTCSAATRRALHSGSGSYGRVQYGPPSDSGVAGKITTPGSFDQASWFSAVVT